MITPRLNPKSGAPVLAALLAAVAIAGCGSSNSESAIAPGKENPNAAAELQKLEKSESTSTTSSAASASSASAATVQTPKSGPLSKEPTVKPPSGPPPAKLVTKELIKGTGPVAKAGDTVTVNYVGVLYKTGKVFDASWNRKETFSFALGKGQVIEGWDKGVLGMRVGGRRELIIPAEEAYKQKGSPPTIPGNEALVFVVDLLGV